MSLRSSAFNACGLRDISADRGRSRTAPTPLVTCGMALAMGRFETILQEEAQRSLASRVVRIDQLGTYNCRNIARFPGWVSEHAYANAIDYARFVLANGTSVIVLRDFDRGVDVPASAGGRFLRDVSVRGYEELLFSNVLTPFYDAEQANHFHLDLGRYRAVYAGAAPLTIGPGAGSS